MTSAPSPPISLSPGGLGGASPGGRAASLSARAILSGSSSLISTNSSAWMHRTIFAGMGAMLFVTLNGSVFALLFEGERTEVSGRLVVGHEGEAVVDDIPAGTERPVAPATTEVGIRGMPAKESGRACPEAAVVAVDEAAASGGPDV